MKSASSTLITFLENATEYVRADLYTFTLSGGGVLRYCSANLPIAYDNGTGAGVRTFNLGPPIQDEGVQSARGSSPSSVDITILGGNSQFTIGGEDILDFLENFGLDGATVRIDRVFQQDWQTMYLTGPIGGYCRFQGLFSEVKELGQTQAVVTVKDPRDVLSTPYPQEDYQTGCLNVFGDAKCGVNLPSLQKSGTAGNGSYVSTQLTFGSGLSDATGYWNLGTVTFTSGANTGISKSIKSYSNSYGAVTVTAPFPAVPAFGDAFTVTPGCQLSLAACQGWDAPPSGTPPSLPYKQRFRGTPYVPPPTTGLPT